MNNKLSIQLIKELEINPDQNQRALAVRCNVSLGSVHYCLMALINKGYVKARNYKNSQNKLAYSYILTPTGLGIKKKLIIQFLKRKQLEYEKLQQEINILKKDLDS